MKNLLHDTLAAVREGIGPSDFRRVRLGGVPACSKVKLQGAEGPCWTGY